MARIRKIGFYSELGKLSPGEKFRSIQGGPKLLDEGGNLIIRTTFVEEKISENLLKVSEENPTKWKKTWWLFKGNVYSVENVYTEDQIKLLIFNEFDKERKQFEKLKQKPDSEIKKDVGIRTRIPEHVRIEVWRRDGGKCVRCGSREKLEYDHIIPVSKGGSNTSRNIELLCEKCNRSKGANIE